MGRYTIVLALWILLASCQGQAPPTGVVSCDPPVVDPPLYHIPFAGTDAAGFRGWIAEQYRLPLDDIVQVPAPTRPGRESLIWEAADRGYLAEFADGTLLYVQVAWSSSSSPTLGHIIECLGAPHSYDAGIDSASEVPILHVDLWYPEQGFIFSGGQPAGEPLSAALPLRQLSITSPGSIQQMLETGAKGDREVQQQFMDVVQPWPGSWQEMQVLEE